jgi:hypothetical protein
MSLFSKLFGGSAKPEAAPEIHKEFRIFPAPMKEAGGHRVAARIEKDIDGAVKTHQLIRSDLISDPDDAKAISIMKAKTLIDEQGDKIFG